MRGLVGVLMLLCSLGLAQPRAWVAVPTPALEGLLGQLEPVGLAGELRWETLDELQRLELLGIQTQMFSPLRTARALALLAVALNDALYLVQKPGVETNVLAAYAAQEVMLYLHPTFPNLKDAIRQTAQAIYREALARGWPEPNLRLSQSLGRQVGLQVVAWGRRDGAARQVIPTYPAPAPGVWVLPLGRPAVEPGWGGVAPIGIAAEALARAAPPPAWDSPEFAQERALFWAEQAKLDEHGRQIADKWAGDPGTVTPAGLWQEAALEILRPRVDAARAVAILAVLNIAMHNANIACWRDKFSYYVARPEQWVRSFDRRWQPYLRTPKHPSYPSGHSAISGAAAAVLTHFFPEERQTWESLAQEASYSRVVAGIHWFVDGAAGLEQGRQVARRVLEAMERP
ncbi:PAP2 superfamily protein [Meiothermus luteus]|uniref:PAP2 superfamily protein n=1 Tax=Meiothermus luteus TaxID=2026184 RepID=A0A399EIZ0_9DEIN|nr:vanadium-dependent haloperoxidase [Meiothermus luteus]RIH83928.1 PAP2 superfamily protein [Meiothermus luteus]